MFFARGTSLGPKWWQTLLGREMPCSQWERPSMHSRCLAFFPFVLFSFEGGEKDFFFIFPSFPMCSHYVPFRFPIGSQYVPQVPNVFPNMCFVAPNFFPVCFWQMLSSFHLYRCAKGEELYTSKQNLLFGEPPYFHFFSDGRIKSARWKKK